MSSNCVDLAGHSSGCGDLAASASHFFLTMAFNSSTRLEIYSQASDTRPLARRHRSGSLLRPPLSSYRQASNTCIAFRQIGALFSATTISSKRVDLAGQSAACGDWADRDEA